MPNRSFVEIDVYVDISGRIDIPLNRLLPYLREWYSYIASRGTDPKYVRPGIIVLGAIRTKRVYTTIKGIPIDIDMTLKGASIDIRISEKIADREPDIPIEKVKEYLSNMHSENKILTATSAESSE